MSAQCLLCLAFARPGRERKDSVWSLVWRREGRCCMMAPGGRGLLVRAIIDAEQMAQLSVRLLLIYMGWEWISPVVLAEVTRGAEGGNEKRLSNSSSCSKEGMWRESSLCLRRVCRLSQRLAVAVLVQAVYNPDPWMQGVHVWWAHACVMCARESCACAGSI